MSFRATAITRRAEPVTSGVRVRPAHLILTGATYTLSVTGPADAYLASNGSGGFRIDAGATEHASGVRLLAVGDRFLLTS